MALFRFLRTLALAAAAGTAWTAQAGDITVSVASSLTNALRDIAPLFEATHPGTRVRLNGGASGALLAQIAKGAPADVFVSADPETMDQAQAQGLVRAAQRRNLVSNTIVVVVPVQAIRTPATLADLARPEVTRLAIGLPASVPAGRYTKAALEAANLWALIEPKRVAAHNVRQALDYVARAEVDAGFVYATDAALMPDKVKVAMTVATSQPILYPIATLAGAPNPTDAARFVDFVFTAPAQAVLARYGFGKP